MSGVSRRTALVGGAMALTGAASAVWGTPGRREGDARRTPLAKLIPLAVGPWRGRDDAGLILPETKTAEPLYDGVLSRSYTAPGLPSMMLALAHGGAGTTTWSVHRPESCYDTQGFTVTGLADRSWALPGVRVPGVFLTARRNARVEQVGYWRRISDGFPVDALAERWVVLRRRLAGMDPEGILVRVSLIEADAGAGQVVIERFMAALVAACGGEARDLLLGPLSAAVLPRTGAAHG